jgi:hypothetical protein
MAAFSFYRLLALGSGLLGGSWHVPPKSPEPRAISSVISSPRRLPAASLPGSGC